MNLPRIYFDFPWSLLAIPALVWWAWWLARTSRTYLPPGRRRAALITRVVVSVLLPLALARPVVAWPASGLDLVFLVDRSASMGASAAREAERWLQASLAAMGQDDRASIVTFGGSATVDRPLERGRELPNLPAQANDADHTDIGAAIRTGLGLLAPDSARRMVLLSDGQENRGSSREAARLAAAAGVPIDVVHIGQTAEREVSAFSLDTPPRVREGERFSATLIVQSSAYTPARLVIAAEGRIVADQETELRPGVNRFVLPVEPMRQGTHEFRAEVEAEDDTFPANNQAGSVTVVGGPPSVLLVEGTPGHGQYLTAALEAAGVSVEVASPTTAPWDSAALRRFEAVILVDVPAVSLPEGQQRTLGDYVQSFGGGLVVVGGEQSYGPGGYARKPLEGMLPVRMDLRGRSLSASVALILVIDTSGSMGGGPDGSSKMDLAKEAAISAAELLGEYDQIGVVAFEDTARWIVNLQPASDLGTIQELIAQMAPGGGTDIYAGLAEAYPALEAIDAKVKHIILLSDGQTPGKDWDTLMARMRAEKISLSSIGIGSDADYALMQRLADLGNGRYYEGNDPFDLPRLVVKETTQVQRAALVEEDFHPIRVVRSPVTEGLDFLTAPALKGYVATTPKQGANVLLVSHQLDPVLTEWQYGLGRVLAWSSDARNRWSTRWLDGWPEFSRFWSQVVRRAARPPDDPNRSLLVRLQGGQGTIRLEAQSDERAYRNFLPSRAQVVGPGGQSREVSLTQVAPGTYEGGFPLVGDGAYLVQASQQEEDGTIATQTGGLVAPYSQEFRALGINRQLLDEIARRTGGSAVREPSVTFAANTVDSPARRSRELWPALAVLAALVFLFDIAVRRLRLEQLVRSRLWRRLERALGSVVETRLRPAMAMGRAGAGPGLVSMVGSGSAVAASGDARAAREAVVASAGRLLAAKQRAGRREQRAEGSRQ